MMHGFNMDNLQGNRFLLKNKNYQQQDKKKKTPTILTHLFRRKTILVSLGKKIRAALEQVKDQKD